MESAPAAGTEAVPWTRLAREIAEAGPVIDMLGLLTTEWDRVERWRNDPSGLSAQDWQALQASQVSLFHPAVRFRGDDQAAQTKRWLDGWIRFASYHPDRFLIVRTDGNWRAVRSKRRIGILLGMQDSAHFEAADDVERFARAGQRLSQLTYNGRNPIGGGCGLRRDPGLSAFGGEVIAEMNRVGMMIDVSHCGRRTTMEAFEASRRSVLITHANCATLTPGRARCKTDEEIRRMAAGGGVIGITAIPAFVRRSGPARMEDVLDHIDHVTRLVGVDHVGIGTDAGVVGASSNVAAGFGRPDSVLRLTEGLLRRGYSGSDIRRILGGNFERVLREHLQIETDATLQLTHSNELGRPSRNSL